MGEIGGWTGRKNRIVWHRQRDAAALLAAACDSWLTARITSNDAAFGDETDLLLPEAATAPLHVGATACPSSHVLRRCHPRREASEPSARIEHCEASKRGRAARQGVPTPAACEGRMLGCKRAQVALARCVWRRRVHARCEHGGRTPLNACAGAIKTLSPPWPPPPPASALALHRTCAAVRYTQGGGRCHSRQRVLHLWFFNVSIRCSIVRRPALSSTTMKSPARSRQLVRAGHARIAPCI